MTLRVLEAGGSRCDSSSAQFSSFLLEVLVVSSGGLDVYENCSE
jgi:hypothetical protein